jgi:hypothetical protein
MEYKFFDLITSPEFDLNQIVKRGIMFKAASAKIANPKETKKNIAKSLNVSERTLQRYANDLNFTSFKKNKTTSHFEPIKCLYCSFIAKNKSGLGAHTRSKHLEELAKVSQNRTKVSETEKKKKKKKEELGLGDLESRSNNFELGEEEEVNVLDFIKSS